MGLGFTEILLILVILMLFFGGKKLPELGKAIGESIKSFKKGMNGEDDEKANKKDTKLDSK